MFYILQLINIAAYGIVTTTKKNSNVNGQRDLFGNAL